MRRALLVAGRELRAERAQPDGLVAAFTFAALLLLIQSVLVGPGIARGASTAAALVWLAIVISALLATTRSFDRELEDDAIEGLVALPGGRDAVYAGKTLALGGLQGAVALAVVGLAVPLLDLSVALPGHLVLATVLGAVATAPLLTLYVAISMRLRARALVVPVLAVPTLVPQLVCVTSASAAAIDGNAQSALAWCGLLAASALVSAVAGLTIGPSAIE